MCTPSHSDVAVQCAEMPAGISRDAVLGICMSFGVILAMWLGSPCGSLRGSAACHALARSGLPSLLH